VSDKEIAADLVENLPEESSLLEIAQEIEFVAGIREGVGQLDRGESLTAEQLRQRLAEW
jgi:hypothetical protein